MFFVFEILNFENRFYFLPHIITHFQPNTSLLNSSLGGYALTTKDGKIAYYQVSEGADSATPFKSGTLKRVNLGTYTSTGTTNAKSKSTVKLSSKGIPESVYTTLTTANFAFDVASGSYSKEFSAGTYSATYGKVTINSYTASTGTLVFTGAHAGVNTTQGMQGLATTAYVYYIEE